MSKRNPTSDLNHDNWDQEDEREDPGHFKAAADDVLKKREIRVAKRRTLGAEDKGTGGLFKSFTGFSGFGAGTATAAASVSFGFAGGAAAPPTAGESTGTATTAPPTAFSAAPDPNAAHLAQLKSLNESVLRWIQTHLSTSAYCVLTPVFKDYERHLADIERRHPYIQPSDEEVASATVTAATSVATTTTASVVATTVAAMHSSMPPAFSFSSAAGKAAPVPVTSEATPTASNSTTAPTTTTAASTTSTAMPPTFSFNFTASATAAAVATTSASTAASTATITAKPPFVFGGGGVSNSGSSLPAAEPASNATATKAASTAPKTTAAFFFGSSATGTQPTTTASTVAPTLSGFAFGSAPAISGKSLFAPGSFLTAPGPSAGGASAEDHEDEEYEPPKPETREIREEGEVFSRRCKLFYMVPDTKEWKERGVGCAHLKPAGEAAPGKAQLIIRADNTLGTILLNILVSKEMTLSVNKNNLSLACIPNPPLPRAAKEEPERRPVPLLVRMKAESDAKELLEKINQLREA